MLRRSGIRAPKSARPYACLAVSCAPKSRTAPPPLHALPGPVHGWPCVRGLADVLGHMVDAVVAQRMDAGSARKVRPTRGSPGDVRERARSRHNGDAATRRIDIGGGPSVVQIPAAPSVRQEYRKFKRPLPPPAAPLPPGRPPAPPRPRGWRPGWQRCAKELAARLDVVYGTAVSCGIDMRAPGGAPLQPE